MTRYYRTRRAGAGDATQVEELIQEWLGPPPSRSRRESIALAIESEEVLLAVAPSGTVGFVHFVVHNDVIDGAPNAFVTALYVRAAHRRRGIGSSLIQEVMREARRRGAVSVETSTTHAEAKRFYEGLGFGQASGDIGEVFLELGL